MEGFQVIIDLIKDSPFSSSAKALLIIFFIVFLPKLKDKEVRDWIASGFRSLFNILVGHNVRAHYLFNDYKYYIFTAKQIRFKCENKTWAFHTIIEIKFNALIFELMSWLKANKRVYRKWDKLKFSDEFSQLLARARKRFEAQIRDKYILRFGNEKGRKFYNIIMEGEQGFRAFHYRNFSIMDSFLSNIFIYERLSNTKLIYKFLGIIDTILAITSDDLYVTFKSLNGQLCEESNDT